MKERGVQVRGSVTPGGRRLLTELVERCHAACYGVRPDTGSTWIKPHQFSAYAPRFRGSAVFEHLSAPMPMNSEERHIRVPRTARYRVLGDPSSSGEVWFVLHGYRQLAERFIPRFTALPGIDEGRRAVVAPEGLSRFYVEDDGGEHGPGSKVGATWMTRADREREIRDYVEYLDRLAAAELGLNATSPGAAESEAAAIESGSGRVVVLGFSQGAATASRWATYGRVRPAELILWGGGLAADLDMVRAAEALRGVRVRLVVGDDDGWATDRAEQSLERLATVGLDAGRVTYAGGHRVEAEVLAAHWPLP